MSVFSNIKKNVTDTAKAAAKKSSELVEVTKLNMSVSNEEDKIKELYGQIGKIVYDRYQAGTELDEECTEGCRLIQESQATIQILKAKILELKDLKSCSQCGNEIALNASFCEKCGAKQEVAAAPEE